MIEGVININKPAGITSADVVAKLREILATKKIGHTGTLDPMATGVLPVCIGRATRLIEYYDADFKMYRCTMKLGLTTDTLDSSGEIMTEADWSDVTEAQITECFNNYIGEIEQTPPRYSALKVEGHRAYDLARQGIDFKLASRKMWIRSIQVENINLTDGSVTYVVECSKGTYIRSLCDDIGRDLGCGAVMTALTRVASGYFNLDNAWSLEELDNNSNLDIAQCIFPVPTTLNMLGEVQLDNSRITAFVNGMSTRENKYYIHSDSPLLDDMRYGKIDRIDELSTNYKVYSNQCFLGIATINRDNELVPRKVMADDSIR